jgi:hypothetical protein
MSKQTYSSEDVGFFSSDSNPFADKQEEASTQTKPAATSKPKVGNTLPVASNSIAQAAPPPVAVASQPAPAVAAPAVASEPTNVPNPIGDTDFLKSAAGLVVPAALGALGTHLYNKFTGGGNPPNTPPPPPPNGAPPPVGTEIKPVDPLQQARLDAIAAEQRRRDAADFRSAEAHAAEQRRKDEIHELNKAKRAESDLQKKQGTPVSATNSDAQAIELTKRSDNNALVKAVDATKKAAATPTTTAAAPAAPVVTPPAVPNAAPPPAIPASPVAVNPEPVAVETAKPPAKAPKAKLEMPEGWGKSMNWLVNQHGVEGARDFIDRYNKGQPFATYDDMMKAYQENTMRPKYSDIPKDVRKARGIAPPTQSGIANKAAGVAGAALLLPTIGEAAQATKEGDTQKARANMMEWLNLHPIGAIANQLFGTSPEELKTLREAEQARKVGGGRGVAPPSAYIR